MNRNWKIAAGVVGAVVALNLLLALARSATGGTPGGPASSSYATAPDGTAALASLLARLGHPVTQSTVFPHAASLAAGDTAVVLDAPVVVPEDAAALRRFVARGGRLVLAAKGPSLRRIVRNAPTWSPGGTVRAHVLAPAPGFADVTTVRSAGNGSWTTSRAALPVLGAGTSSLLDEARIGRGTVLLLADSTPLDNAFLAQADNAAFGADAAGPSERRVVFFEAYHGYGHGQGFLPIPVRWRTALIVAALAGLLFLLSRARRFGPPEAESRDFSPARLEYVDSLARTLARTGDRRDALLPMRDELRRRIALRAGLGTSPGDDALVAAATRLGFSQDEARTVVAVDTRTLDEVALGRAFTRTTTRGRPRWRS